MSVNEIIQSCLSYLPRIDSSCDKSSTNGI